MTSSRFQLYVGIDWATEAHQVCVTDATSTVLLERAVTHSGDGLRQLADELAARAAPGDVAVAIEVPRGAVVETLLERGLAVFSINPKQLDRFRDRHTVAGAKDDRRDAFVLANSLRTDEHLFRRVQLDDPVVIQLRELSRVEEDLVTEMNRLCNRLREQLLRFFPQALRLVPSANEQWLWKLLERVPDPAAAMRVRERYIERLLRDQQVRRFSASEVLAQLRATPLHVAPGTVEAARTHIALLLPRLHLVWQQRKHCAKQMSELFSQFSGPESTEAQKREHRDAQLLLSMPGIGRVVAGTMLAEASQPLRERDYQTLRTLGGVAPVTHATGKRSGPRAWVSMRSACNQRLRRALYHWARVSTQRDPRSKQLYAAMRQRGHGHGRALRGLADRLLAVLVAVLRSRTPYDASRRGVEAPA